MNKMDLKNKQAMTTTIHTIEDLIRILDDHPEWTDALRARLLTKELIELPEKFTQFVAEMHSFVAEMHRFVEATNRCFDALENRVASIQDDVGMLKGAHARSAALRETPFIANDMGFRWVKDLTTFDLWEMIDSADTSGIPTNELRSFRRADLIIEANDQDGTSCYIAVEISFTANGRDTSRALRNAEFLTRFTGKRTYSAVVGVRRDNRIQDLVDSGEVFWYQLDSEVMEVE